MYSVKNVDHDIVVVGSGFSGLAAAIRLKQSGRGDFVVLERGDSLGGTWRDNTYPGCGCDVPTPLYSYSFAPNPEWSHFYAKQNEIRTYMEDCADRFGVRPHLRFGAEVVSAEWEDEEQRWRLQLAGDTELTARMVIGGIGGLTRPAYPEIDGIGDFAGPLLHSAAWDHSVDLEGKRVAVIGTGASSVQLTPEVAKVASHLDVFQRTAPWIFPKTDLRFGPRAKALFRRLPATQRLLRESVFWISEGISYPLTKRPALTKGLEWLAKAHLRASVRDPELRARLTPDYKAGCKRMLPSNHYLRALTRDNVDLVTEPIERITATGVITADGAEHPCDVLVCSTGFDISGHITEIRFTGREGLTITEAWADGVKAHRGTMVAGFPNMLLLSGPNTGTGSTSQIYMIEAQVEYVLKVLDAMDEQDAAVVEATPDAQRAYNERLQQKMQTTVWLTGGCASWYLDENGHSPVLYPDFSSRFKASLSKFRPHEHTLEPAKVPAPNR